MATYMPSLENNTKQMVVNVLTDQLRSTLMLQFPAKLLAVAAMKFMLSFLKSRAVSLHQHGTLTAVMHAMFAILAELRQCSTRLPIKGATYKAGLFAVANCACSPPGHC